MPEQMPIDTDKLHQFLGRFVNDLRCLSPCWDGSDRQSALGCVQRRLPRPMRQLRRTGRRKTNTDERYVFCEWLASQAAGDTSPANQNATIGMTAEQILTLAREDGPAKVSARRVRTCAWIAGEYVPRITGSVSIGSW